MEHLLPPLSGEQFSSLESDILENGCYAPVIVNEDMILIDGHNRFCICKKHGLPYKMLVFSFTDLLEAKQWALDTQKGRRNLDKWELGKIALKLRPEIEARARANLSAGGGDHKSEVASIASSDRLPSHCSFGMSCSSRADTHSGPNIFLLMICSILGPSLLSQASRFDVKTPLAGEIP